jgi:hypothetical protein
MLFGGVRFILQRESSSTTKDRWRSFSRKNNDIELGTAEKTGGVVISGLAFAEMLAI